MGVAFCRVESDHLSFGGERAIGSLCVVENAFRRREELSECALHERRRSSCRATFRSQRVRRSMQVVLTAGRNNPKAGRINASRAVEKIDVAV